MVLEVLSPFEDGSLSELSRLFAQYAMRILILSVNSAFCSLKFEKFITEFGRKEAEHAGHFTAVFSLQVYSCREHNGKVTSAFKNMTSKDQRKI